MGATPEVLHSELIASSIITGRKVWLVRHIPSGVYGEHYDWTTIIIKPRYLSRAAILYGLTGIGMTRNSRKELCDKVRSMGFTSARAKRHGGWKTYPL